MNNKQLIAELSKQLNRNETDVLALLDGLSYVFRDRLSNLDSIAIPGFGEFNVIKEDEYILVDKESGKKLLYPPCMKVKFKPSTKLRKHLLG